MDSAALATLLEATSSDFVGKGEKKAALASATRSAVTTLWKALSSKTKKNLRVNLQKIYVEVEVYGLIRGCTSAQVKSLRPFFSTFSTTKFQNLSKYQVLLFRGIFQLSKLHFDDLGPGI